MKRSLGFLFLFLITMVSAGTPNTGTINLAWDGKSEAVGYRIYYGTSSQTYTTVVDTSIATTASIGGLQRNRRYYFVATALYLDDESGFSNEVNSRAR